MPKVKITTLTPIHISSGNEYEKNFNLLENGEKVYIFDEFKIVEFFIEKKLPIGPNLSELKKQIAEHKKEIIQTNIHKRIIEANLSVNKPLLEHIATSNKPIISGSSIKGAIRTAYIYKLVKDKKFDKEIDSLNGLEDKIYEADFQIKKSLLKKKDELIKSINRKIDKLTKNKFKYLKVSDTFKHFDKTKIYKTINIKKDKAYQANRSAKVEEIANFVESIPPNISSYINIEFDNEIANICNAFYQELYKNDFNYYFSNTTYYKELNLSNSKFLLNVGRFSGAELKSVEAIRSLKKTGADVDWETTTRTFALEKDAKDKVYFEKSLLPFGWVLCEIEG